jgi:hypothetical protein
LYEYAWLYAVLFWGSKALLKYTGILLPVVFTNKNPHDIMILTPRGWKGNYREELEALE